VQCQVQNLTVHKFGGASVKDASAFRNVEIILQKCLHSPSVVVVSAIGKTTNKLEKVFSILVSDGFDLALEELNKIILSHQHVIDDLSIELEIKELFVNALKSSSHLNDLDAAYDVLVASGEDASTRILFAYLDSKSWDVEWRDVREIIKTDARHNSARVDESRLEEMGLSLRVSLSESSRRVIVTQGFIGMCPLGKTTTLGREGSDYSAALLACAIRADEVVIWKDVPGMLNADPSVFEDTQTMEELDYSEALELSYYGASVIHPRTVKPLQNLGISLIVRSFMDLHAKQTRVASFPGQIPLFPMYISRPNVTRFSIGPSDQSFVGEDHLTTVFSALDDSGIHVRMMQNSAVKFDIIFDSNKDKELKLIEKLGEGVWSKVTRGLELLTVRYGSDELVEKLTEKREVLMEQKSPSTVRRLIA
jgi:aspartate kinase